MFLLDDILLAPIKGLAAVCQRVHQAVEEDLANQEKEIMSALAELHQLMDAGRLGDEDFNTRESDLLDRLDTCREIQGTDRGAGGLAPLPSAGTGSLAGPAGGNTG